MISQILANNQCAKTTFSSSKKTLLGRKNKLHFFNERNIFLEKKIKKHKKLSSQ